MLEKDFVEKRDHMKTTFWVMILLFFCLSPVPAGELYVCEDSNGDKIITSTPQDGMKRCSSKETYKELSEQDREQIRQERERIRSEAETRNRSSSDTKEQSRPVRCERKVIHQRDFGMKYGPNVSNNLVCIFQTRCFSIEGKVVFEKISNWESCQ